MNKLSIVFFVLMPLVLTAQPAMMRLDDIPGDKEVSVTNWVPVVNSIVDDILSIGTYTNRLVTIEQRTNVWNTAYGWGDHAMAGYLVQETDPVALPLIQQHAGDAAIHLTQEQANRIANAVTNEQDLAALRTYHYGSPDIVESPAEWFTFNSDTGTITGFNWQTGREHVVIPWSIGGVSVVGLYSFLEDSYGVGITNIIAPMSVVRAEYSLNGLDYLLSADLRGVVNVTACLSYCPMLVSVNLASMESDGNNTLCYCDNLRYVSLPKLRATSNNLGSGNPMLDTVKLGSLEEYSYWFFNGCPNLTHVTFSRDMPLPAYDDPGLLIPFTNSPNVVVYVDNPHAEGWGSTLAGRPVVRLPVTADSYTLNGQTITNWPTAPDLTTPHTAWTANLTPVAGAVTLTPAHGNQPFLRSASVTTVAVDWASYPTNGISRIALTLSGAGPYVFPTNNVVFVGEPELSINGYNRILIYRTADEPIGTAAILPGGAQ